MTAIRQFFWMAGNFLWSYRQEIRRCLDVACFGVLIATFAILMWVVLWVAIRSMQAESASSADRARAWSVMRGYGGDE